MQLPFSSYSPLSSPLRPRPTRPWLYRSRVVSALPPSLIPSTPVELTAPVPTPKLSQFQQMVSETAPALVGDVDEWSYSQFLGNVQKKKVLSVITNRATNSGMVEDVDGAIHTVIFPEEFQLQILLDKKIDVYVRPNTAGTGAGTGGIQRFADGAMTVFNILFQVIVLGVIVNAFLSSRSSSSSQFFNFMGNTVQEAGEGDTADQAPVKFEDVAGLEGPKGELVEIVDFLKNPEKYTDIGAELPKGVLLYGPPGTGKTMLAKAVAGEAGVPFLFCSGSEFVQVFVGVGASRVRDLFKRAREKAPCIVFIDEIDAIGRERSMSAMGGGNTEQEQTMNQILTEMDGFKNVGGKVIVIAATNRKDVLDEALIRSGRFDRHVEISLPSKKERRDILAVLTRASSLDPDVSLERLAALTQGMAGADLKNLVNEAKLFAARADQTTLSTKGFLQSLDKLVLGLENNSVTLTDEQTKLVAYHEAGHALLGILSNDYDLLNRVTIVPRGDAGGLTIFQEKEQDLQLYTQQYLLNRLIVALGGRVAEQCVFGNLGVTTGASSDLENVQNIARGMVTNFGFNETLGHVSWSEEYPISGAISEAIDSEIKYLVEWAHTEATRQIQENEFYLHRIAEALIVKKTLYYADILKSVEGLTCDVVRSRDVREVYDTVQTLYSD